MNEIGLILEKIREYDKILLFKHTNPDGDCIGATKGLQALIRAAYPEKDVRIIDDEYSAHLAFLGGNDEPISDEEYADRLAIVVDTATERRIANPKFALCKEIIKIDHHIPKTPYGDIQWVEEERSSLCEMIVYLSLQSGGELEMTKEAAEFLYTGMVTDSGRFRYASVNGETLRMAAHLLDWGIDMEKLYAHVYMRSFEELGFKAHCYRHAKRTQNGVVYLYISALDQKRFDISFEQACSAISYLENIEACLSWIAFIENPKSDAGEIRVRLRSRFVDINEVGEQFRGGGHAQASGATVYSQDEVEALLALADETVRLYKENNTGWI